MAFRYLKLYGDFAKQNLLTMMEYKNDFIIGVASTLLTQVCGVFFIWIVFENVGEISGWTFYQVTFVYGLLTLAKAIDMIFFYNLAAVGVDYIRKGEFDILMIRPVSPLFQIIAGKAQQEGFGLAIVGVLVILKSILELNLGLGLTGVVMLVIFAVCGGLIIAAISVISATSAFWTVSSSIVMETVASLQECALYPIVIYPKFLRFVLTWVIPYGFASFYPANYFFDKGYYTYSLLSPLVALFLWCTALKVWDYGIRHYASTGS